MAASMVSAFSMSASAITEGTVIDFEDGDCSFVYMNHDDPKASGGSDDSVLSVEDYDGSKQLKVDVQNCANVPKVWFDLDKITDRANTVQINSIELDLTFVPKNPEEAVGWAGGAIGAAGEYGKQVDPNWSDSAWSCEDGNAYEPGMAAKVHVVRKFLLPSTKYTETGVSPFFGIMRWAAETNYVMYVDNIVLKDKDGNNLPVGQFAAAETEAAAEGTEETAAPAVEETAAPVVEETAAPVVEETVAPAVEETAASEAEVVEEAPATEAVPAETAAPAETTAAPAPAPVATTPVTNTGNVAVASIAAVMVLAGAVAIASKRK